MYPRFNQSQILPFTRGKMKGMCLSYVLVTNYVRFDYHCCIQITRAGGPDKLQLEWDVSEIEKSHEACVHGVPVVVSPTRKSRKNAAVTFFEGEISDGEKAVCMISFDTSLQAEMKKALESKSVVALSNCQVKQTRDSDELEIVISKRSKLTMSPRKSSGPVEARPAKGVKIEDLIQLSVNQEINVTVKVKSVESVGKVTRKYDGKDLKKQDVVVGDSSGYSRMVLWEDNVNGLEEGKVIESVV